MRSTYHVEVVTGFCKYADRVTPQLMLVYGLPCSSLYQVMTELLLFPRGNT